MARYFGTLLMTVPPRDWIRASTSGVTSARMSTVTISSAATSTGAGRRATPYPCACRAGRSCELTFLWVGVRCAFSASSASICRTVFTANSPPACAEVCCAPTGPTSSGTASTAPSSPRHQPAPAHAMIPVVRGSFIFSRLVRTYL